MKLGQKHLQSNSIWPVGHWWKQFSNITYLAAICVMGREEGVTLFIAVSAEILLQLGWFSFLEHKATCAL